MTKKTNSNSFFSKEIPSKYAKDFAEAKTDTNIGRMRIFSIYIVILQITLNILNIIKPSDGDDSNIFIYIALSMGTLLIGIIYLILFTLVKKEKITNFHAKNFLIYSLLYIYTIIQLTFCTLNILSTGGINSYIIAILIVGMVPIIKPIQSILTIFGSLGFIVFVMYLTRNISGTWDSILLTDLWTNLIIITGLVLIISVIIYNMFLSNFLKSMALQEANDDLEVIIDNRTRELKNQTRTAEIASKAKSDFLARMSHEIRTPLNAIIGMTRIAKKSESKEKIDDSLDEISKASVHLTDIINDVLDMSKIEDGELSMAKDPFSLSEAINEVERIIELRAIEKKVSYVNEYDEISNLWVLGDKTRFKQILLNIIGNAVKFTNDGGLVKFTCKIEKNEDIIAHVRFSIKDNGIGMSEKKLETLFTAFEQEDQHISVNYGGTGLGLTISQNLINQMHGSIQVESEKDKGTLFIIDIPFEVTNKSQIESSTDENEYKMNFSNKRFLLAEDVDINQLIVEEILSEVDAIVDVAENGKIALDKFNESDIDYYDVILMDIQMPEMNGYETAQAIRKLDRKDAQTIPIIAMTANAYQEDIDKSKESGMNDHLAKPINHGEMLSTINEYLD